jgi:histidinol phosphatase-like enzyme|tara:strand:- start:79 stop:387 length:309 start_codon:yes stop_codon:yes gene_type:complete
MNEMNQVIHVDIDETICNTPDNPRVYEKAEPIKENIDKINKLYDEGNTIVYWTARGSRSKIDWYDLTKSQLEQWGAKFHLLRCDKPFFDILIDDRTMRIEEL